MAIGIPGGKMLQLAMLLKLPGSTRLSNQPFFCLVENACSVSEIHVRILKVPFDVAKAALEHICAAGVGAFCGKAAACECVVALWFALGLVTWCVFAA